MTVMTREEASAEGGAAGEAGTASEQLAPAEEEDGGEEKSVDTLPETETDDPPPPPPPPPPPSPPVATFSWLPAGDVRMQPGAPSAALAAVVAKAVAAAPPLLPRGRCFENAVVVAGKRSMGPFEPMSVLTWLGSTAHLDAAARAAALPAGVEPTADPVVRALLYHRLAAAEAGLVMYPAALVTLEAPAAPAPPLPVCAPPQPWKLPLLGAVLQNALQNAALHLGLPAAPNGVSECALRPWPLSGGGGVTPALPEPELGRRRAHTVASEKAAVAAAAAAVAAAAAPASAAASRSPFSQLISSPASAPPLARSQGASPYRFANTGTTVPPVDMLSSLFSPPLRSPEAFTANAAAHSPEGFTANAADTMPLEVAAAAPSPSSHEATSEGCGGGGGMEEENGGGLVPSAVAAAATAPDEGCSLTQGSWTMNDTQGTPLDNQIEKGALAVGVAAEDVLKREKPVAESDDGSAHGKFFTAPHKGSLLPWE
jgi:hypothetical protein